MVISWQADAVSIRSIRSSGGKIYSWEGSVVCPALAVQIEIAEFCSDKKPAVVCDVNRTNKWGFCPGTPGPYHRGNRSTPLMQCGVMHDHIRGSVGDGYYTCCICFAALNERIFIGLCDELKRLWGRCRCPNQGTTPAFDSCEWGNTRSISTMMIGFVLKFSAQSCDGCIADFANLPDACSYGLFIAPYLLESC